MSAKFKDNEVVVDRPIDATDPGFKVKGHRLRWVSSSVEMRRTGRAYIPLKISCLPESATKKLKETNPSWFNAGDTIRRRDLVLCIAPIEEVEKTRKENKENQKANEGVFMKNKRIGTGSVKTTDEVEVANERVSTAEKFA